MNAALEAMRQRSGLSITELWIAYIALGGMGSPSELEATLSGRGVGGHDDDILAHTLNERLLDMGLDHPLAYPSDPVPDS